jgi:hypothetical protein
MTLPRVTADAQAAATTKASVAASTEFLPLDFRIADLDPPTATRVVSIEARVRLSAQDEEYDLSLIRDEDLLP